VLSLDVALASAVSRTLSARACSRRDVQVSFVRSGLAVTVARSTLLRSGSLRDVFAGRPHACWGRRRLSACSHFGGGRPKREKYGVIAQFVTPHEKTRLGLSGAGYRNLAMLHLCRWFARRVNVWSDFWLGECHPQSRM